MGGGGHRGDVGDDGERPRQRRRGAEGPSGPGDWLGHAGLVSIVFCDGKGNSVSIVIVLLLTLGFTIHEDIVMEALVADHGARIYVDEDVVRCCQFGVDVVVQEEVALDVDVTINVDIAVDDI